VRDDSQQGRPPVLMSCCEVWG